MREISDQTKIPLVWLYGVVIFVSGILISVLFYITDLKAEILLNHNSLIYLKEENKNLVEGIRTDLTRIYTKLDFLTEKLTKSGDK